MPSITSLRGRIVFNSRGSKTIEVDIVTDNRFIGRACAPSGASVGKFEAQSFPENKAEKALAALNDNSEKFVGLQAEDMKAVYDALRSIDKTDNYSKIGGSVAYALSIAAVDSAAKALSVPLFKLLKPNKPYRFPFPLGNILGGGAHAGPGTPDLQEILACPVGAKDVVEALEMNFKLHAETRKVIESIDRRFTYGRGDEGAWAPNVNNDQALEIVEKSVRNCGFALGRDMAIGIDFASSSFWDEEKEVYDYARQGLKRDRRADRVCKQADTRLQASLRRRPSAGRRLSEHGSAHEKEPQDTGDRRRYARNKRSEGKGSGQVRRVQRRNTEGQPGRQPVLRHEVCRGMQEEQH
jgi:enolase